MLFATITCMSLEELWRWDVVSYFCKIYCTSARLMSLPHRNCTFVVDYIILSHLSLMKSILESCNALLCINYIARDHIMFPWFLVIICYGLRVWCLITDAMQYNLKHAGHFLCICFGTVEKHMHLNGSALSFPCFY